MQSFTIILALLWAAVGFSFQPRPSSSHRTFNQELSPLGSVIKAEDIDFEFDVGQGGVRLAQEFVIKVKGKVKHKPGSSNAQVKGLLRYNTLSEVDESKLPQEVKIIATGRGEQLYKNPGETVEKEVILAPVDAVRDALVGSGSAMPYPRVVLNFAGGDDLQVLEVIEAVNHMVLALDVSTKSVISFNSVSHSSLPLEKATLTVVGLPEENLAGGLEGVDKAVANGEVYVCDGKYWTVSEKEANNAKE